MWAVSLILLLISFMLNVGSSRASCSTSVSVLDLGCYLHWNCSDVNTTSVTFTVQTMTQGAEWQNVSHCVEISSSGCNLSQIFNELDLYKSVRLGLNLGHGKMNWTESKLCDPLKHPHFSAPSLSLSLKHQQLWVEVTLPCAPYTLCQDEEEDDNYVDSHTCCHVSNFLPLNTTVTVYNNQDMNDHQTTTKMLEEGQWKLQFDLTPGKEHCVMARFASSQPSDPQCIHVHPFEIPNLFILALCGVSTALVIVGFVLRRWWFRCTSTDLRLPKSLMSLQDRDREGSVVEEPRQTALEEEESIVHLSIVSLNMLPTDSHSLYPPWQSLEHTYYTTALLPDRLCDGNVDTIYHSRDVETDGVTDPASRGHYLWPRWSSLPALRTGVVCLLGNFLHSEGSGIPLSSVRVAGAQMAKMESDHSFKVLPALCSDMDSSSVIC